MSAAPSGKPVRKILVVDDNEIIIKTISLKLQGAGYEVITAMDGAEAVAAARKENPDLILLDISFPPDVTSVQWDGFRIMEWFHRLEAAKKFPSSSSPAARMPKPRIAPTVLGPWPIFKNLWNTTSC